MSLTRPAERRAASTWWWAPATTAWSPLLPGADGRDGVVVLEQLDRPGGGSRTGENLPRHRFGLRSAAHNIIKLTDIPAEMDLPDAGLGYLEMAPFSIAVHADGRRVRC